MEETVLLSQELLTTCISSRMAGPCGVAIVYNILSAGTVIMLVWFRQPYVDILWAHSVILGDTV